jgi:hypothetical protein
MRPKKNKEEKRKTYSITMSPEISEIIDTNTTNRSRYIEFALLDYFKKCGIDVSKIKL